MFSRMLMRLAAASLAVVVALVFILHAVASADPDLHGVFGWVILLGLPALLLIMAWVFAPRRRP